MSVRTKVLLLDEDEEVFRKLEVSLCSTSYQLHWIHSGFEIPELLSAEPYDVCLVDSRIAHRHGDSIPSTSVGSGLPLIVLTEDKDSGPTQVIHLGAQDYLCKRTLDAPLVERTIRYALDRKHAELRIHQLADLDHLTGLLNRNSFHRKLEESFAAFASDRCTAALIVIDLDRFRAVNEAYGHRIGDQLLQVVGQRIQQIMGSKGIAARFGSDEFGVLLEGSTAAKDAVTFAAQLIRGFQEAVPLENCAPMMSCCLGITVFPSDGDTVDDLLRYANAALAAAKVRGPGNYESFTNRLVRCNLEKRSLEVRLRRAFEQNEFTLHYQPQMDLRTSRVVGLEALLRWNEPERGMTSPATFVPCVGGNRAYHPGGRMGVAESVRATTHLGGNGAREHPYGGECLGSSVLSQRPI